MNQPTRLDRRDLLMLAFALDSLNRPIDLHKRSREEREQDLVRERLLKVVGDLLGNPTLAHVYLVETL